MGKNKSLQQHDDDIKIDLLALLCKAGILCWESL
jgi:hypothetical protein